MNKVYIVLGYYDYEGYTIEAVCTSLSKAEAIKKSMEDAPKGYYKITVEDYEVTQ